MFRTLLLCCALAVAPQTRGDQIDPMGTASWETRRAELFAGTPAVFDSRVAVLAPAVAENPLQVPVAVNVHPAIRASRVLVFADYNPILKVLAFEPGAARPYLAFRVKMQQSGPVRAAALGADGVWHVGHTWVVTTGGGCTLPALGRTDAEWETRLNEVAGRLWTRTDADTRVRFRIVHPMDTGLAPGIPAFFLQRLDLVDTGGRALMGIEVFEPVSENPMFTLELPAGHTPHPIRLTGVDNNGNRVRAELR